MDRWPRRWDCGTWPEWLGWEHISGDTTTYCAFMAVCWMLWVHRRKLVHSRATFKIKAGWAAVMTFFFLCGTDHILSAIIFWFPDPTYEIQGHVKALLPVASWFGVKLLGGHVAKWKSPEEYELAHNMMREIADADVRAIYAVDLKGEAIFANRGVFLLLGYHEQEIIGRNMHELIHYQREDGSEYPVESCAWFACMTRRTVVEMVDTVWRRDGTACKVEVTAAPIVSGVRPIGCRISLREVSLSKGLGL